MPVYSKRDKSVVVDGVKYVVYDIDLEKLKQRKEICLPNPGVKSARDTLGWRDVALHDIDDEVRRDHPLISDTLKLTIEKLGYHAFVWTETWDDGHWFSTTYNVVITDRSSIALLREEEFGFGEATVDFEENHCVVISFNRSCQYTVRDFEGDYFLSDQRDIFFRDYEPSNFPDEECYLPRPVSGFDLLEQLLQFERMKESSKPRKPRGRKKSTP